jgi:hypothetical protein
MPSETNTGQRKEVELNRGLFFVHYKSAEDMASPPQVKVSPAPGHERRLQITTHPDSDPNTLWHPNTSLVVRANAPATLHVEVVAARANGSRVAAVKIEPITQGKATEIADFSEPALPDLHSIRVLGHVAGLGDVIVAADQWIAGPSAPSRIEGLAIEWPNQAGLQLRYAVKSGAQTGKMTEAGGYAGTRGRAMPLTGLILELSGELSNSYQLTADAIFLNSPTMRVSGKSIVLSGPTGREPLVGLRLSVEQIEKRSTVQSPGSSPRQAGVSTAPAHSITKAPAAGRVRVFRSRLKQPAE